MMNIYNNPMHPYHAYIWDIYPQPHETFLRIYIPRKLWHLVSYSCDRRHWHSDFIVTTLVMLMLWQLNQKSWHFVTTSAVILVLQTVTKYLCSTPSPFRLPGCQLSNLAFPFTSLSPRLDVHPSQPTPHLHRTSLHSRSSARAMYGICGSMSVLILTIRRAIGSRRW